MKDTDIIFKRANVTLKDIKRAAATHHTKNDTARALGVSPSHFERVTSKKGLSHLFSRKVGYAVSVIDKILDYSQKHGKISSEEIKSIGWQEPPSIAIKALRNRHYIFRRITEVRGKHGHVWEYDGKERYKQYRSYGGDLNAEFNLQKITVPCMICGYDVQVQVRAGEKLDRRRICRMCKERNNGYDDTYTPARFVDVSRGENAPGGVKKYKPGDPEFEKIAAQCTPLSEIKHKDDRGYLPFF